MTARQKVLTGPLAEIELKTKAYSDAREVLAEHVATLQAMIDEAKREAMPLIRRALALAAERQAELRTAIEATPASFDRPRTQIFHGIKVGYRKGSGKVIYDDAARVVKLIRKHLPDQADLLIKVEETPIKKAIGDLSADDVKKIGCTIESTGDVVEIKAVDSEVDKIVTALLKEAAEEAEGEA